MASRKAADPKYYYGEVEHSLQHLPRWYQFCSLGGVLWVIYAKNNPVLVWIVRHLHSSFYTENMWHSSYRTQLEHMSFNERVCFTLYGMALALVAALLFRVFCHDRTRVGTPLSQLFPDRKGHTIFVLLSLCAVEVCTIYWEIDAQFSSPHSKLLHMVEAHNESMHDGAGVRNIHYIVQREVMKRYLQGVILHRILAMIITAAIRFMIDAPWRKHVALRWYMATYAAVLVAMEMISIFVYQNWSNYTSLVCILWGLTYIGLLNYTFGPSLRAGTIVTADIFTCVKEACKSIATIFMVWMMATIIVFTAIVSFNVVELIGIWVMMTLMILWFPAIIDSCSTSFMVFLTALTCYVAVAMEALNLVGATRFGMVLLGLWLNTSLLYNATVHLCQTRTVGVVLIVSLATWFMLPSLAWMRAEAAALAPPTPVALSAVAPERRRTLQVLASIATHVYYFDVYFMGMLTAHLDVLLRVAAFRPLPPTTPPMLLRISGGEGAVAFQRLMEFFVVAAAGLLLILRLIKKYQGPERKAKMRRLCVPLITVGLLFRKSIRTVVLVVNVVVFLCSWHVAKLMVVPTLVVVLPEVAAKAIAAVVSCAVLGSMMDMKETTYESIIRIMGGMDPPDVHDTVDGSSSSDDDRQPVEEGSPT